MRRSVVVGALALVGAGALFSSLATLAVAATISYGTLGPVGPGVTFVDVAESSGTDAVPLYGAPSPFVVGLSFLPTGSFGATASGGGSDLTDGQLNYTVVAPLGLTQVNHNEGGVYTLIGVGSAATQTFAAASLRATVTEINGASVAPISLTPSLGAVAFNLLNNPGLSQPWQISLAVNVASGLASLGYGPNQRATRVDVVIDNQLVALSQAGSAATIIKTEFGTTTEVIPEPAAFGLASLALCGLVGARRRAL